MEAAPAVPPRGPRARLAPAAACVALAGGLLCAAAHAQIYTCRDERGKSYSSDKPIPECARQPMRELDNSGTLKREIAPPPTREQIEAREREIERLRMEEARRRQQESRDRALLTTYPDLETLERARRRQLADIDKEIAAAQRRMIARHRELEAAQAEERATRKENLRQAAHRRVLEIANAILADDSFVTTRRADRQRVEERFDDDVRRLRELLGEREPASAAAMPAPPRAGTGRGSAP